MLRKLTNEFLQLFDQPMGEAVEVAVDSSGFTLRAPGDDVDHPLPSRRSTTSSEHAMPLVLHLWREHWLLPPASESHLKHNWELLMYLFVFYNCLTIPFQLAFLNSAEDLGLELALSHALDNVDVVIDVCFWLDMLITFRTAIYEKEGYIETNGRTIAWRYGTSWFPLDFLATFPWEALAPSISWMSFLKAFRLVRISRLLKKLEQMAAANAFRMVKTLGLIVLLAHWIGCIWWLLGSSEGNLTEEAGHTAWLFRHRSDSLCSPLPDTAANAERARVAMEAMLNTSEGAAIAPRAVAQLRHNWRHAWCAEGDELYPDFKLLLGDPTGVTDRSEMSHGVELILQQYISSLYWAFTMLMKSPYIGPDTLVEKIFASLMVVLGALIFAVVLGNVVGAINAFDANNAALRAQLANVKLFSSSNNVPRHIERQVKRFVNLQWELSCGVDNKQVLSNLPKYLQTQIVGSIFADMVACCSLLNKCERELCLSILQRLVSEVLLQKMQLISCTRPCSHLYFLVKGMLQVEIGGARLRGGSCSAPASRKKSLSGEGSIDGKGSPRGQGEQEALEHCKDAMTALGRSFKSRVRSRVLLERQGSSIGLSDPLHAAVLSPFTVSSIAQGVALSISRAALKSALQAAEPKAAHNFCLLAQQQHNTLLESLKASHLKSFTVARRGARLGYPLVPSAISSATQDDAKRNIADSLDEEAAVKAAEEELASFAAERRAYERTKMMVDDLFAKVERTAQAAEAVRREAERLHEVKAVLERRAGVSSPATRRASLEASKCESACSLQGRPSKSARCSRFLTRNRSTPTLFGAQSTRASADEDGAGSFSRSNRSSLTSRLSRSRLPRTGSIREDEERGNMSGAQNQNMATAVIMGM